MTMLNIPSKKKTGGNTNGEHGPDAPVVTDLPLVTNHDHVNTINPITEPYRPAYMIDPDKS